jgi:hypothetical protein
LIPNSAPSSAAIAPEPNRRADRGVSVPPDAKFKTIVGACPDGPIDRV